MRARVVSHRAAVSARVQEAINRKVLAMGTEARNTLLTSVLTGARGGREYRVPGTSRTYRASRPGEAPATRLGDLRRSYDLSSVDGDGVSTSIMLGSRLDHALALEAGTSRVAQRPHLKTAIQQAQPKLDAILRDDWGI